MIYLDYTNGKPIYLQICDRIKQMVAVGALKPGDTLPAIRTLARETGINHNTVKKAFDLLEKQGVIVSVPGKGTFVKAGKEFRELSRREALNEISQVIEKNLIYQVSFRDIIDTVEKVFHEKKTALRKMETENLEDKF